MIPHWNVHFIVGFPAMELMTAAKAFWSVAVIVVSAALINYNKYLMNPSRQTRTALCCRRVCFVTGLVGCLWLKDGQSLANSHCLMGREHPISSFRGLSVAKSVSQSICWPCCGMWGFRIPWCCLAKDFAWASVRPVNCLPPLLEDPSWLISMWQTQE